jgi:hypothetical protein
VRNEESVMIRVINIDELPIPRGVDDGTFEILRVFHDPETKESHTSFNPENVCADIFAGMFFDIGRQLALAARNDVDIARTCSKDGKPMTAEEIAATLLRDTAFVMSMRPA